MGTAKLNARDLVGDSHTRASKIRTMCDALLAVSSSKLQARARELDSVDADLEGIRVRLERVLDEMQTR